MDSETRKKVKKIKEERNKMYANYFSTKSSASEDEMQTMKEEIVNCNKEIAHLEKKNDKHSNEIYCCVKLAALRDCLIKEELKQLQSKPELMKNYCELKPAKIVCYERGSKYGNNFIENGTIIENSRILENQKFLAFKIFIPTNNSENTYAFKVKLHARKSMASGGTLKQKLIELKFDVNALKFEDLCVDITYGTLEKYYKTCFKKALMDIVPRDDYPECFIR